MTGDTFLERAAINLRAAIWNNLGHDKGLGKALGRYGMVKFNRLVEGLITEEFANFIAQPTSLPEGNVVDRCTAKDGEIVYPGVSSDLSEYCEIVSPDSPETVTQPTDAEVREVRDQIKPRASWPTNAEIMEAARENPNARAYTNAQVATLLERISPDAAAAAVRREGLRRMVELNAQVATLLERISPAAAAVRREGLRRMVELDEEFGLPDCSPEEAAKDIAAIRQHKDSDNVE